MEQKIKGCVHNIYCEHIAGRRDCRAAVELGTCNPPSHIRIHLGITLNNVDPSDFARLLQKHGGRMPMQGFVSK